MMQIIGCKECNKQLIEFNQETITINVSKSTHCASCNKSHTDNLEHHYFCSKNCAAKWIRHNWREPYKAEDLIKHPLGVEFTD